MEYGGRNWGSLAPFSAAEFIGRKSLIEVQLIVQCKRSLEIAPIYLLICVNKDLSTVIAQFANLGRNFSRLIASSMARLGRPKRP